MDILQQNVKLRKIQEFLILLPFSKWNLQAQGRHFNFFLGAKIFFYFSMPPDYWKIGKNSTL